MRCRTAGNRRRQALRGCRGCGRRIRLIAAPVKARRIVSSKPDNLRGTWCRRLSAGRRDVLRLPHCSRLAVVLLLVAERCRSRLAHALAALSQGCVVRDGNDIECCWHDALARLTLSWTLQTQQWLSCARRCNARQGARLGMPPHDDRNMQEYGCIGAHSVQKRITWARQTGEQCMSCRG